MVSTNPTTNEQHLEGRWSQGRVGVDRGGGGGIGKRRRGRRGAPSPGELHQAHSPFPLTPHPCFLDHHGGGSPPPLTIFTLPFYMAHPKPSYRPLVFGFLA